MHYRGFCASVKHVLVRISQNIKSAWLEIQLKLLKRRQKVSVNVQSDWKSAHSDRNPCVLKLSMKANMGLKIYITIISGVYCDNYINDDNQSYASTKRQNIFKKSCFFKEKYSSYLLWALYWVHT